MFRPMMWELLRRRLVELVVIWELLRAATGQHLALAGFLLLLLGAGVIAGVQAKTASKAYATSHRVDKLAQAHATVVAAVNTRIGGLSGQATSTGQPPGQATGGATLTGSGFFTHNANPGGFNTGTGLPGGTPTGGPNSGTFAGHTHDFDGHTHDASNHNHDGSHTHDETGHTHFLPTV